MARLLMIGVLLATVLLSSMAANDTFKCYDYNPRTDDSPKIVGNCKACVNVTLPHAGAYPYHTVFTQGCSYEVEKKLGCRPIDDEGSMCICDTELCNWDGKPYPPKPTDPPRVQRLRSNKT